MPLPLIPVAAGFFSTAFAWLFSGAVLPWLVRTVMRIVCGLATFAAFKTFIIPSFFGVGIVYGLFNGLPAGIIYMLKITQVHIAIGMICSAYITAILMNRLTKACAGFK